MEMLRSYLSPCLYIIRLPGKDTVFFRQHHEIIVAENNLKFEQLKSEYLLNLVGKVSENVLLSLSQRKN